MTPNELSEISESLNGLIIIDQDQCELFFMFVEKIDNKSPFCRNYRQWLGSSLLCTTLQRNFL